MNNFSTDEITLYAMLNPDRKIYAIKALRAIAAAQGEKLGLKAAKDLIDNIATRPIIVADNGSMAWAVVKIACEATFETHSYPPTPTRLSSHFTMPEREFDGVGISDEPFEVSPGTFPDDIFAEESNLPY